MLGRVKSAKPEEEITITAGTETKEFLPASGKAIKRVTVKPTPSQIKSVTPAAAPQEVVPDGGKLLAKVTVAGDADLVAENIRGGVNIFGVLGSLTEGAKVASGRFTVSTLNHQYTLQHNLGKAPAQLFIIGAAKLSTTILQSVKIKNGNIYCDGDNAYFNNSTDGNSITINGGSHGFRGTYDWIAIAE